MTRDAMRPVRRARVAGIPGWLDAAGPTVRGSGSRAVGSSVRLISIVVPVYLRSHLLRRDRSRIM